ncbi:hypothetical protein AN191_08020 [Loktanella sp. 5RATIMAR09]|uniref:DUF1127 domain-containing protein n=1 Tax=Loktanella sp. 5RATIMAR09 TaxID=1225655 RepID=UPI0006EB6E90|nr:DUF1127 domain-containing protein [Loktanella sp. 5RATIMAR09]KQI72090.1 hypothetical protein AN191_08020 [Loktanella sp. 5RATIMAR09]
MTLSIRTTALHPNCQPKPRSVVDSLRTMIAVSHQRRQLRALDDHMLADIGISRTQAVAEAQKSVWNAPQHWRQ